MQIKSGDKVALTAIGGGYSLDILNCGDGKFQR